jgi:hypothetical protein
LDRQQLAPVAAVAWTGGNNLDQQQQLGPAATSWTRDG